MSQPPLYPYPHDAARRYVAEMLAMGDELSRTLSEHLPSDLRFFTLTASNDERERKLTEGGLKPALRAASIAAGHAEQTDTDDELLARLLSLCSTRQLVAVVFEDTLKRRGDPVLDRCLCALRYVGNEVLHVEMGLGPLLPERLMRCIREARALPRSLGMLSLLDDTAAERLRDQETLSPLDLTELVHGMQMVFISAFDGESFLVGLTPDVVTEQGLVLTG